MPPLEYGSNAHELKNFHIFYSWKKAFYEIDWLSAKDEQKKTSLGHNQHTPDVNIVNLSDWPELPAYGNLLYVYSQ